MKRLLALAGVAALLGGCAHYRSSDETSSTSSPPSATSTSSTASTSAGQARTVASMSEAPLPEPAKPVFENEKVRVSRVSVDQGQRITLPSTPNQMMYPLADCRLRLDSVDGRSWELDAKKDQVIWSDAAQRGATATGTQRCDFVLTELKSYAGGTAAPGTAPQSAPAGGVQTAP